MKELIFHEFIIVIKKCHHNPNLIVEQKTHEHHNLNHFRGEKTLILPNFTHLMN